MITRAFSYSLDDLLKSADKIITDQKDLSDLRYAALEKLRVRHWAGLPLDFTELESLQNVTPYAPQPLPHIGDMPAIPPDRLEAEDDGAHVGYLGPRLTIIPVTTMLPHILAAPGDSFPPRAHGVDFELGRHQEICGYCGKTKQKFKWCLNPRCKSNIRRNRG